VKNELGSKHNIASLPWRTVCILFENSAALWRP